MRVYEVQKGSTGLDGLRQSERPDPEPGSGQVLIRIRATSLNYRDHLVVIGRRLAVSMASASAARGCSRT
jgi:NADPH:quinone reductase-like Zn-dependent oxidoreductase